MLLVPCALLAFSVGCETKIATDAVPATTTSAGAARPPVEAAGNDPDLVIVTVMTVDLQTKLAEMCNVPASKLFFKFDSATVRPGATELIEQIATCAKTGAAKGKALKIIGRTDPRGSPTYNEKLGMERAEAVAKLLRDQGVQDARVELVSKGEEAAEPSEPAGWPYDRRVTIRLAD